MIVRRFTVATLVMLVALLTACDGDSTGNGDASIFGTYTLQTVFGKNLPVDELRCCESGVTFIVQFTAGSVRLNSDNTFSISITLRVAEVTPNPTASTTETLSETGVFTVTGSTIRFTDSGGEVSTGSIAGNTLAITITITITDLAITITDPPAGLPLGFTK